MKRVVVSGATGAVGMAFVEKLIAEKKEILILCRKGSARNAQIPRHPQITCLEADLDEYGEIRNQTGKEWDVFYHFAWAGTFGDGRNDTALQLKNAAHTLEAVRLAKRFACHTFVGAGSQAEYGRVEGKLQAETPAFPQTAYGAAKLCAGQLSRLLCKQLGMKHIWVRILSVYGPYDGENTMVMSAIRKFLHGEPAGFTKGEQQWDYLYSKDAARALYLLGESGKDGKIYCLGSGEALPLKDYIRQIREIVNPAAALHLGKIPYAAGQVMYLCADLQTLQEDTGFVPAWSFAEGIRETLDYVRKRETWSSNT